MVAGTFIIGGTDEIQTILDDQIVKIQAMNASPFIKPFKERASKWETLLQTLQVRPSFFWKRKQQQTPCLQHAGVRCAQQLGSCPAKRRPRKRHSPPCTMGA